MGNFVQATENDVHMYEKFGGLTFYVFCNQILQYLIYNNFL
jgi:hypothetical protein